MHIKMSEPPASAPASPPPPSLPAPDLKDLERLVEFELKRFDDKQRAYGWTPWGLMVTLAALAWSFGERTKSPGDWIVVGLWWAALLLALEFLTNIRNRLPKGTTVPGEHVRYFSTNWILTGSREYIVLDGLLRTGACILIMAFGELPRVLAVYWWIPTLPIFEGHLTAQGRARLNLAKAHSALGPGPSAPASPATSKRTPT